MSNFMPFQKLPKLILCFISFLVFCLCAQDAVPELVQSPLALVTSVPEELTSNDIKSLQQFLGKVTAETRNKVPNFPGIEYMSRVRNIEMLVLKKQMLQARTEYIRIVNELTEFRVKAGVKPPVASVPKTKTVEDEIVQ